MIFFHVIETVMVNFQIFTHGVHTLMWAIELAHYLGSLYMDLWYFLLNRQM